MFHLRKARPCVSMTLTSIFLVQLAAAVASAQTRVEPVRLREDDSAERFVDPLTPGSHVKVFIPSLPYIYISHAINGAMIKPSDNARGWEYDMATSHRQIDDTTYEFKLAPRSAVSGRHAVQCRCGRHEHGCVQREAGPVQQDRHGLRPLRESGRLHGPLLSEGKIRLLHERLDLDAVLHQRLFGHQRLERQSNLPQSFRAGPVRFGAVHS